MKAQVQAYARSPRAWSPLRSASSLCTSRTSPSCVMHGTRLPSSSTSTSNASMAPPPPSPPLYACTSFLVVMVSLRSRSEPARTGASQRPPLKVIPAVPSSTRALSAALCNHSFLLAAPAGSSWSGTRPPKAAAALQSCRQSSSPMPVAAPPAPPSPPGSTAPVCRHQPSTTRTAAPRRPASRSTPAGRAGFLAVAAPPAATMASAAPAMNELVASLARARRASHPCAASPPDTTAYAVPDTHRTFRTFTGQLFRTAPDSAPDSVPDSSRTFPDTHRACRLPDNQTPRAQHQMGNLRCEPKIVTQWVLRNYGRATSAT